MLAAAIHLLVGRPYFGKHDQAVGTAAQAAQKLVCRVTSERVILRYCACHAATQPASLLLGKCGIPFVGPMGCCQLPAARKILAPPRDLLRRR